MKTAALLALVALLAPAAFLVAYGARRAAWPAVTWGAVLLAGLILGARWGTAW
jgi:hypothetical protein